MSHIPEYIETIKINGSYQQERRAQRERRSRLDPDYDRRYERRLGKSRRYLLKIDIEV